MGISRRQLLHYVGLGATATAVGSLSGCAPIFRSPDLEPFVDELPIGPGRSIGSVLQLRNGRHQFHSSLPIADTFGMDESSFGGPRYQAIAGEPSMVRIQNSLGPHPLREHLDLTVPGTMASDADQPRASIHLHGGVVPPSSDGHPMDTFMPGEEHLSQWPHVQEACALWFHDHSHGITRLNVHAGLFATYDLRDEFDTGTPTNPIGLPSGEFELSLTLQDRGFDDNGQTRFRAFTFVPEGSWEGGLIGDVATVNGTVWPRLKVGASVYRLRLLNASNLTTYDLRFSNGAPLVVIGNDQGLLDAPVSCAHAIMSPGERLDVLVDFSNESPGTRVVLENSHPQPFQAAIFGTPVIRQVMAFDVNSAAGPIRTIPERLRGAAGLAPTLEPLHAIRSRVGATREVTINQVLTNRNPPAWMTLDNVGFNMPAAASVQGRVEQWNFINLTPDDHPMHLHLGKFRVLNRQSFNLLAMSLALPRPESGIEWHPHVDQFATESPTGPEFWERGWKDTVRVPGFTITRVVVQWPRASELGFDPDATYTVSGHHASQTVQGYVFHCHVLDHEDFEMMRPFRIISP